MTVGGVRVGALWIGGLEPYMDDSFLQVSVGFFTIFFGGCCVCVGGGTVENGLSNTRNLRVGQGK